MVPLGASGFAFLRPLFFLFLHAFVLFLTFTALTSGLDVDCFGQLSELLVSFLLFFKRLFEKRGGFVFAKNIRVSPDTAVGGYFIVLNALRRRNQPGVQ